MANYVKNLIRFSRNISQKKIDEVFQTVIGADKNGKLLFDFNVLIPMPESLNIESGPRTKQAMELYRAVQLSQKCLDEADREMYALGETACNNVKLYGFANWHDWRLANWETERNSFNVEIDKKKRRVSFCTSWSFPEAIAIALTKRFPGVDFIWDYADEDASHGAGELVYKEKKISAVDFDGGSNEAYQIYNNCWNNDDLY